MLPRSGQRMTASGVSPLSASAVKASAVVSSVLKVLSEDLFWLSFVTCVLVIWIAARCVLQTIVMPDDVSSLSILREFGVDDVSPSTVYGAAVFLMTDGSITTSPSLASALLMRSKPRTGSLAVTFLNDTHNAVVIATTDTPPRLLLTTVPSVGSVGLFEEEHAAVFSSSLTAVVMRTISVPEQRLVFSCVTALSSDSLELNEVWLHLWTPGRTTSPTTFLVKSFFSATVVSQCTVQWIPPSAVLVTLSLVNNNMSNSHYEWHMGRIVSLNSIVFSEINPPQSSLSSSSLPHSMISIAQESSGTRVYSGEGSNVFHSLQVIISPKSSSSLTLLSVDTNGAMTVVSDSQLKTTQSTSAATITTMYASSRATLYLLLSTTVGFEESEHQQVHEVRACDVVTTVTSIALSGDCRLVWLEQTLYPAAAVSLVQTTLGVQVVIVDASGTVHRFWIEDIINKATTTSSSSAALRSIPEQLPYFPPTIAMSPWSVVVLIPRRGEYGSEQNGVYLTGIVLPPRGLSPLSLHLPPKAKWTFLGEVEEVNESNKVVTVRVPIGRRYDG
eukprot:PhM_4_TR18864/c1_g1_i1/m.19484